jgi:hypothetical protein
LDVLFRCEVRQITHEQSTLVQIASARQRRRRTVRRSLACQQLAWPNFRIHLDGGTNTLVHSLV